MRVGFDSRPAGDVRGIGRYARSLLAALREAERGEVVERPDPRGCDVFHAPWMNGALLHSPLTFVKDPLISMGRHCSFLALSGATCKASLLPEVGLAVRPKWSM